MYAGDPEDEFCQECDGLTIKLDDGQEVESIECGGYSPKEDEVVTEQVEEEVVVEASSDHADQRDSNETTPTGTITPPTTVKGVTVEIQAESGVSFEVRNAAGMSTWYKLGYTEKVLVPEGADVVAERHKLWERVNLQVDDQVQEVLALNNK